MAALSLTVIFGFAALAIDVGTLYNQKRSLQSATDAAALAAAYDFTRTPSIVDQSLASNGFSASNVQRVSTGFYCSDSTVPIGSRFQPQAEGCPNLGTATNAVRVSTSTQAPLYFGRVLSAATGETINATAMATRVDEAGFMVGTGVASLNGGILNAVLSGLTGGSVSLDLIQYQGLLNTNISALDFLNALATQLNVTAGTYGSLLSSSVDVGQVIQAEITALSKEGDIASVAANILSLQTIAASVSGELNLTLGDLIDLGVWQTQQVTQANPPAALQAGINLFNLTDLALEVSNGKNFIAIPTATINLGGLATLSAATTIIEPPQSPPFGFGPVGITVHTSQVRLQLDLQVLNLGEILPILQDLLPGLNLAPVIDLPIYIEIGDGNGTLTDISCKPNADTKVTIAAQSAVANAYIGNVPPGQMSNFSAPINVDDPSQFQPATLLNVLGLLTVTGKSHIPLGGGTTTPLTFSQDAGQIGATPPFAESVDSTGLLASIATLGDPDNLVLNVNLLGIPVQLQGLVSAITGLISPLLGDLDSAIVDPLLQTLGVSVGNMDVFATGVRCGVPVLVQ